MRTKKEIVSVPTTQSLQTERRIEEKFVPDKKQQYIHTTPLLLSNEDRKRYAELVVGVMCCPWCAQNDIKIINDNGATGKKSMNYLEKHRPKGIERFCLGSKSFVDDL